MPDDLMAIHERARARVGADVWLRMSADEQTQAVYQEFRLHDSTLVSSRGRRSDADDFSNVTNSEYAVRLRLVGHMESWTVAGDQVLPTGRKTRALFAVIALTAPRPALRGRLAELLWSRRPEEQARASLRQEIQLLLKALAPAKAEVLRVTRDHLSLVPGMAWIDVAEIMRPATSRQAALSLVDGELLEDLDGVDPVFDAWLTTERERVRDRARAMAETLLREQTVPASITAAAQRLLQIDRAHEEAWRALMRAYAEQGERGMAIQAYDRCRGVLAEMLDATPSAETQALLKEIRGPSSNRLPTRQPVAGTPLVAVREGETRSRPGIGSGARDGPRVGVLPLRGVGIPSDVAYLGPSLASEITAALSRFRWFSVVTSNSLARLASEHPEQSVIRRGGDVDFLLDGAIQRSRNKLRVTLRLLDLRQDNQVVWARRFDRGSDDLLTAQEEISAEVAAQIDPAMLIVEAKRGAAIRGTDISAYELILQAVPYITRLERNSFMRAGSLLEQAVTNWPEHSDAHRWYAVWHSLLLCQHWAADPRIARGKAARLAERAIAMDPYSPVAFSVLGHIRAMVQHRPSEAVALHQRAIELNPNFAGAWALAAITQAYLGQLQDAERFHQRFRTLSPLDPFGFLYDGAYAINHVLERDYQTAAATGRAVTQLNPGYTAAYKPYLSALGHLGRGQEAAAVLRRLMSIEPGVTVERCLDTFPLAQLAHRELFMEGLKLAGVP
jgi:DNA-binding SARP family transcriptional activator/TolB-like protein